MLKKVYAGKSRKYGVILFCRECCGFNGHREEQTKSSVSFNEAGYEVSNCPSRKCPLRPYRLTNRVEPTTIDWL